MCNPLGKNAKDALAHLEKNYEVKMSLEKGLNLVASTMNNSVDSPKTNTEIMVISSQEIRNLTSDELENLYNSVQKEAES